MSGLRESSRFRWLFKTLFVGVAILALALPAMAYKIKAPSKSNLDSLAFSRPEMRVPQTTIEAEAISNLIPNMKALDLFRAENGTAWHFVMDQRLGRVNLLDGGAIPFIPGAANTLRGTDFGASCDNASCIPVGKVETLAREFLAKYQDAFQIDPNDLELDPLGSTAIGDSLYFLRFQWKYRGIPVEGGSVFFRINNGNLLQVATDKIGPIDLDPVPTISAATAWDVVRGFLGRDASDEDRILEPGYLSIVPITPKGINPDTFGGGFGTQAGYALVYKCVFARPDVQGTWEATVDAHTGELLRFVDINRYGHVHGQIRPSDGLPPEEDRPFPYANTGQVAPNNYTDGAGNYTGNTATTTLTGRYAHIIDACGAISAVSNPTTGEINFGGGPLDNNLTDCNVPTGNTYGLGNTKPSRTLFYNTTAINLKAQIYNPSNTWLTSNYVNLNVNGSPSCNAGSSGLNIYFYRKSSGCNNLGEIPGVAMHEWAHSYDTNDGSGGQTPPLETYADWTAIIQTHNSCTGAGFLIASNCDGYGDACTGCTGVRDCDYTMHAANTPWTSANHTTGTPAPPTTIWGCGGGSYNGPCGWEDHCESGLSTQALWDFVYRDLTDTSASGPMYPNALDITTAWMLEDRLWFAGVITNTASYTCSGGVTNGCSGTVLYSVMRALDDDGDGTANGTPHAHAIYHALNRHLIDCNTYNNTSPQNQNQTSCPALNTPTLSAVVGNNQVTLNWTTGGASATRYFVYKNESGCGVAFNRIAIVTAPTLSYTDSACVNGVTYYYRIQSATANDSCVSPSSNCMTVTPQPCTASITLDKTLYSCASTVGVTVLDSTPGSSPWSAEAWSTSDATHRSFTLVNNPIGSAMYTGTFTTTTGAGGAGVVHVAAGDTLTVRFVDPDNCGAGALNVDKTASIDCSGPVISNVLATSITDSSAIITWTTNESANSRVTYGLSTPPGTNQDDLTNYVTSHSVMISGLTGCTPYYFSVTSADVAGNSTTDNNAGAYYSFTTYGRSYAMGPDNVEGTVLSWVASGTAGAIWHQDTCKSNSPTHAWKAGAVQGTCPGAYVNSATTDLTWNANITLGSAGHGYHLVWREWYATESGYDWCLPQISVNGGGAWTDLATHYAGASGGWITKDIDLAAYTGSTVRIRFHFTTDGSATDEGWYVDDISISKSQGCSADVKYQSHTRTDVCNGTGSGNNNGIWDPGEDSVITVTAVNSGMSAASNVVGTLTTSTPGITVTDNTATFPNMTANGGTGVSQPNHFSVRADSGITCGTVANFTLHTTCTENPAGSDSTFAMTVGQAGGTLTAFSEAFTGVTVPALPTGWTTLVTTGNTWVTNASGCTGNALMYPYNSSAAANSWAFSPAVTLTAGVTYTMAFNQKVYSASYPEAMEVKVGLGRTAATQTVLIYTATGLTNTACAARGGTFTVPTTGTYYFGFHCTSAADMWNLYVDDIAVTYTQAASCNVCTPTGCTAPGAPTLTGATGVCTGVNLTWTAGTGTTNSYNVYRFTGACGGAYTKLGGMPVTGLTYSDTTAVAGTSYAYVVRGACDAGGTIESVNSNCLTATRTAVPAAPTGVSATAGCTGNSIAWTNAPTATSHNVLRGTTCGTVLNTFTGVTTPYNDTTAVAGTTYNYWVVGINTCGTGANSSCATAARLAVPAAPTGVSATAGCTGNSIAWTNAPTATSHNVLRGTTCGTVVTTFTGVTTPYNDTTAVAGTTYNYWVVGVNACGTSANSSCATAARLAVPAAPAIPTFTAITDTTLTVNWTAVSGATTYDVWRAAGGACAGAVKLTGTPIAGTTYPDSGLVCNTAYSYYITANNTCGTSANGTCGPVTTAACGAVPPEVGPGTTPATSQGWTNKTTATWPSEATATSYTLYRGMKADLLNLCSSTTDSCTKYAGAGTSTATIIEDPTGIAGGFYWYLVTGTNGSGEGTAGVGQCSPRVVNSTGVCP